MKHVLMAVGKLAYFAVDANDRATFTDAYRQAFDAEAYAAHMTNSGPSRKRNHRGLTHAQERFAKFVAEEVPLSEAASQAYPRYSRPASQGSRLAKQDKVRARIDELVRQRDVIRELSRDSLTIEAIDVAAAAKEAGSYSASVSGLRLVADLQGMLTQNPVAEATTAFLQFLAGNNTGKPAVEAEANVLREGAPSS